jgi:hypothetical protein
MNNKNSTTKSPKFQRNNNKELSKTDSELTRLTLRRFRIIFVTVEKEIRLHILYICL